MKTLTKIRLINWHYFTDEEIEIEGSTLFTGNNAAGKSTILDAVQYVLVADLRNVRFNVSAHDEYTKRDLMGYLRCKTGVDTEDGKKYLRRGDITTYAVLEFYDTLKKKHFLLGVIADSYRDEISYESRFFKIEDCRINNELFYDQNRLRNIKNFKAYTKKLDCRVYSSVEEYRNDLLTRLGNLNERFFTLFVKAISFKPIVDIRNFVYSYVLDQRAIDIEAMKQNFLKYREYAGLVELTRRKLARLKEINDKYQELLKERKNRALQEYMVLRARRDMVKHEVELLFRKISENRQQINRLKSELEGLHRDKEVKEKMIEEGLQELASNPVRQKRDGLCTEISRLNEELEELKKSEGILISRITETRNKLDALSSLDNTSTGLEEEYCKELYRDCSNFLQDILDQRMPRPERIERMEERLNEFKRLVERRIWELEGLKDKLVKQLGDLEKRVKDLRKNKMDFGRQVEELRSLLKEKLDRKYGGGIVPRVLCELLEIRDEKWQNAVEGFLNTQRFDLIVEPKYFDYCLFLYERYKKEKSIFGVGLVNTAKVLKYTDRMEKNSLAEEVITDNPYARGYVNQIMGNVIKCEDQSTLKNHRRSITPTCMTYINNTARQINFEVYRVPYIGKRAIRRQLEICEKELEETRLELDKQVKVLDRLDGLLRGFEGYKELFYRLRENINIYGDMDRVRQQLHLKNDELNSLDLSYVKKLEDGVLGLKKDRKQLEERIEEVGHGIGRLENEVNNDHMRLEEKKQYLGELCYQFETFEKENKEVVEEGERKYNTELQRKSLKNIVDNYTISMTGYTTRVGNKVTELQQLKMEYNSEFHFGGRSQQDDVQDYLAEFRKLAESELPEYEEKIKEAQKRAEEEFKEHFIARLQESINNARTEFAMLNDALKDIEFGGDRYEFLVFPNQQYKKFYDMITDPALFEGYSLFDGIFQQRHREAMDQLFEKVLADDGEYIQENVRELTDYRTYLDYDIRIRHENGEVSTYSRVCRVKSGGETQTPYYVAIVASFAQLYRLRYNPNSIRLMMFDEAFNRMDSDRIENSINFINRMGMQVLVAAPTDKSEYITPYIRTTILVVRDGHVSWTERFVNGGVKGEIG